MRYSDCSEMEEARIPKALAHFCGQGRRCELVGLCQGVFVVEGWIAGRHVGQVED